MVMDMQITGNVLSTMNIFICVFTRLEIRPPATQAHCQVLPLAAIVMRSTLVQVT